MLSNSAADVMANDRETIDAKRIRGVNNDLCQSGNSCLVKRQFAMRSSKPWKINRNAATICSGPVEDWLPYATPVSSVQENHKLARIASDQR